MVRPVEVETASQGALTDDFPTCARKPRTSNRYFRTRRKIGSQQTHLVARHAGARPRLRSSDPMSRNLLIRGSLKLMPRKF
jgi:hypothetical protein